ncbi:MAG: hypothetical protein WCX48_10520, partial [Bacteroidales bacterium]
FVKGIFYFFIVQIKYATCMEMGSNISANGWPGRAHEVGVAWAVLALVIFYIPCYKSLLNCL